MTAVQGHIGDALSMATKSDEKVAWDLKDDSGTTADSFNGVAYKGRRLSPREILQEYQVTDDPRGMTRLLGEPRPITRGEANMLGDLNAAELLDFQRIREQAFEWSAAAFPEDNNDGHMDAMRHAYWNALMARRYGVDWTERYGMAHERLPGNPSDREAMDLFNNEVGRKIALENPTATDAEIAGLVQQAVLHGRTVVMDADGNLVNSDKVKIGETGHTDNKPGAPDEGRDLGDPGSR